MVMPSNARLDEAAGAEPSAKAVRKKADLPPLPFSSSAPARSETQEVGAEERPAMRSVGLDLGSKRISFCEVGKDRVVKRATCSSLPELQAAFGSHAGPARVAVEACREVWHLAGVLRGWGTRSS